jgi:hypothetical protein
MKQGTYLETKIFIFTFCAASVQETRHAPVPSRRRSERGTERGVL